jgi:hypothetical protein
MLILNTTEDYLNSAQNTILKRLCSADRIGVAFLYRNEIQLNQYKSLFHYTRQNLRRMYFFFKRRHFIHSKDLMICLILQLKANISVIFDFNSIIMDVRAFHQNPEKSYEVDDIQVGDLLIDTVIRFCQREQYHCSKIELFIFIWKTHFYINFARAFFGRYGAGDIYLTEYTTYLHHGIYARIARHLGLRVCTYGCIDRLYQEFSFTSYTHAELSGLDNYLPDQIEIMDSKNSLKGRMSGKASIDLTYMRNKNLGDRSLCENDLYDSVDAIVFLHDFYDSTNLYRNFEYLDFYTWAFSICDNLIRLNKTFYIKGHPNQIAEGAKILEKLKLRYPERVLQSGVDPLASNISFKVGITVYGTIAYELAYAGIPSIIFADASYSKLSFTTLMSKAEDLALHFDEATSLAASAASDAVLYQAFRNSSPSGDLKILLKQRNRLKFANCENLNSEDEEVMKNYCNHVIKKIVKGE